MQMQIRMQIRVSAPVVVCSLSQRHVTAAAAPGLHSCRVSCVLACGTGSARHWNLCTVCIHACR